MQRHFHELKAEMNQVRDKERDKLTKLTLESNAAIKEIKRQKEKASISIELYCPYCLMHRPISNIHRTISVSFSGGNSFLILVIIQSALKEVLWTSALLDFCSFGLHAILFLHFLIFYVTNF